MEENRLTEDADRVRKLCANAPADRAWRRRGYLVLCRARPDRVHRAPEASSGSAHHTGSETLGGRATGEQAGGELADVVMEVLGLQEEGMFWTIVGSL